MQFTVTQEDIQNGVPHSAYSCALAKAFRRQGFPTASIGEDYFWADGEASFYCSLPPNLKDFVHRFDKGEEVKPFTFELEIPEGTK